MNQTQKKNEQIKRRTFGTFSYKSTETATYQED